MPHADRHLLALHALRQRQLLTSFLHGRRRTWRDRRRIWPAVMIALALVALIIAGTSVVAAFQRQQQVETERTDKAAPNVTMSGGLPWNGQRAADEGFVNGPLAFCLPV